MLSTTSSRHAPSIQNPMASTRSQQLPLGGSNPNQNSKKNKKQSSNDATLIDKENSLNDTISSISRPAISTSSLDLKRPVFGCSVLPLTKNRSIPPIATTAIPETPQPFQLHRTPLATTATSSISQRTPYSILSLELNLRHSIPLVTEGVDEEDDDLLLFSPVPPATTKPPIRQRPQPTRLSSPPERVPLHHSSVASVLEEPDPQIAVFVSKSTAVANTMAEALPPKQKETVELKSAASFIRPPLKQKPSVIAPVETPILRSVAVNSIVSTSSTATPRNFTSTEPKKASNSVCMDLTNMFMDAAPSTATLRPVQFHVDARAVASTQVDPTTAPLAQEDDPWAEKQVDLFTKWLNFLFYPSEDHSSSTKSQASRAALRSVALHQQMAQGRRKAATLFHSTEFQNLRDTVCLEIGRQRIALRKDRDLYANLDDRGKILSLLLSYSTPWLRLGLETMFHTIIQPDIAALRSPKPMSTTTKRPVPLSRLKVCLKNFIIQHVLSDEQIQLKYTGGKCKVPSGQFEERYRAELRTVVVYRLLVLILFLDRAKMARVLDDEAPNFFVPTSAVKSTRSVLLTFCRSFLQAEGDFTKHLARLGIHVHYQQEAMDELDFTVTNLRVDLNDGVRLTRMTELLTGCPTSQLIAQLRLPAVSRLQKFHNVQLAMDHLQQAGVPISNSVAPHHIVDGHREMVLKLLWSVVGHCCLQELLSVDQVQREIERIQKLGRMTPSTVENELPLVLLQWCNIICRQFGHPVTDWSYSFADGKAMCLLIHYYHPTLLRWKEICRTTRDPLAKYCHTDVLLANERAHGMLANTCISGLGGLPEVVPICDTLHPPDEKTMLFAVTFLCSRLIESGVEVRACLMIQQEYRRYRRRIARIYQDLAAAQILRAWRHNRDNYYTNRKHRYGAAVLAIEAFISEHRNALRVMRLRRLQNEQANVAATLIQKQVRSWQAHHVALSLVDQRKAVIYLQSKWRQALARRLVQYLVRRDKAARLIQWVWHSYHSQDTRKNHAATQIQRMFRGYWHRVQFVIDILDIIAVQSCVRRYLVRREYLRVQSAWINQQFMAALLIQSCWRRRQEQKYFRRVQERCNHELGVVKIQTRLRQWNARRLLYRLKHEVSMRCSATKIQSIWRMFQCYLVLVRWKVDQRNNFAAVAIQSAVRRYQAENHLARLRQNASVTSAVVLLQAMWRAYSVRTRWIALNFAATRIQALARRMNAFRHRRRALFNVTIIQGAWRRFLARSVLVVRQSAIRRIQCIGRMLLSKLERYRRQYSVLLLQCIVRKFLAVCQLNHMKQSQLSREFAAICIQRRLRGFLTLTKFQLVRQDAVMIQKTYRRFWAFQCRRQKNAAVLLLQSTIRRFVAQRLLRNILEEMTVKEQRKAEVVLFLQSMFRGFTVRKFLQRQRCSSVAIQSLLRGHAARQRFLQSKWNVIKTQSIVRRWLAFRRAGHRRYSVLRIQCIVRQFFARCRRLSLVARKYRAALEGHSTLTIQRLYRGMKGRQQFVKESSARMIQKTWRCYTVHVDYMLSLLAAMDIQAAVRRYIAMAAYEYQYAAVVCIQSFSRLALTRLRRRREEACTVVLQSFSRMVSIRSNFLANRLANTSATFIQAKVRRYMARSSFLYLKSEATTLQRFVRGYLTRLQLKIKHIAASEIQRIWLGFVAREYLAWKVLAVIQLQSFFRRLSASNFVDCKKKEQIAFHHLQIHCARKIQRAYRGHVRRETRVKAVRVIERAVRLFLSRTRFGKVRQGFVRVQCLARGQIVRRHRSKKLEFHARRIEAATQKALSNPSMKLACQTQVSLNLLQTSKSLSEIMAAVCVLEMSTRLSQVCCEAFVQAGAPDILFSLIQTCNRSLPHTALLQYILLTMTNVARFDALVPLLATVTGVEILLDLVQMFRDKELVFCLVAKLLERLVRSNEDVLAQFISRENLKRLKGVRDLCVRKLSLAVDPSNGALRTSLPRQSWDPHRRRSSFEGGAVVGLRNGTFDLTRPDVRQGVRSLQRIIRWMEDDSN